MGSSDLVIIEGGKAAELAVCSALLFVSSCNAQSFESGHQQTLLLSCANNQNKWWWKNPSVVILRHEFICHIASGIKSLSV